MKTVSAVVFAALLLPLRAGAFYVEAHPLLGATWVDDADAAAYKAFQKDLARAGAAAGAMGIRRLPILKTDFSGEQLNPRFDIRALELHAGALPPRAGGPNSYSLITLHEIGHAALFAYAAGAMGLDYGRILYVFESDAKLVDPMWEFFADSFAAVLMDDPVGQKREFDEFASWYESRKGLEKFWLDATGYKVDPDYFRAQGGPRRFVGEDSGKCWLADPHVGFETSRKVLWRAWTEKFGRDQGRAGELLRGLGEEIVRVEAGRLHRRAEDKKKGRARVPGRLEDLGPDDMGDEAADPAMAAALARRFGQAP